MAAQFISQILRNLEEFCIGGDVVRVLWCKLLQEATHLRLFTCNMYKTFEGQIGLFPYAGASYFLSRRIFRTYWCITRWKRNACLWSCNPFCPLKGTFSQRSLKDLLLLENALSRVASSNASTNSRVISGFSSKISKKDSAYRRVQEQNYLRKANNPRYLQCHLFLNWQQSYSCHETLIILFFFFSSSFFFILFFIMQIETLFISKWEPSKLELVSYEFVDQYFEKVDNADWEYLQLPPRANLAKNMGIKTLASWIVKDAKGI
ncbi:hypothetical protein PVL29_017138 [Vitis rotundifolia]|uniref:3-hydroxyisobutyryl-CoA hydrolase n=1 Tax=Vitis rotundifolia TaxID=103349 RepID=A0AA38ZAF9_VITRO|nr:hypothetical protein PVL29_017138 [Vitis rotundifolia]